MHDGALMMLSGELPIWNEQWQARVQMAIDGAGKERPVSDMIHQRIGDYGAFKDYQRTVLTAPKHISPPWIPPTFSGCSSLRRIRRRSPVPTQRHVSQRLSQRFEQAVGARAAPMNAEWQLATYRQYY